MRALRSISLWLCLCFTLPAQAGRHCEAAELSPQQWAAAAESALTVAAALDAANAEVALLARAGTDLSKHGLHYSHVGFVLREHPLGRWTVVHLLNHCASDASGLFAEGLVNFFADDLHRQDARIVWLQPDFAERLARLLRSDHIHALHEPRYNLIARPDSRRTQNSTAWVLELLAAADYGAALERRDAQAHALASGFTPDEVRIAYSKRVAGGLLADNLVFTDHPVATRLSGRYPVVTVRAILRFLESRDLVTAEREWRGGIESVRMGPA
ncbi:MAG: DUF2145 domain-containing protein [Xanthomonadales bacterium]|nr:DUF2145 domain-containing protein [Xanthomonadales bacterium]